MKKNRIFMLVLLIAVLINSTSFAAPIKTENNAFGSAYSLIQMDFEDSVDYNWAEITGGAVMSGSSARIIGDVNFLKNEYIGKTYFEFEFIADDIANTFSAAMGNYEETMLALSAAARDGEILFAVNGSPCGSVFAGEKVYVSLLADASNKKAEVSIRTNSASIFESRDISITAESDIISYVGFRADIGKKVYADNIKIERELRTDGTRPVITKCGNYFNAQARTPYGGFLYLARYHDERFIEVVSKESSSDCSEVFMEDNSEPGDTYKAFVWDEELTPLQLPAFAKRVDINSSELTLNGSISAQGYYSEGDVMSFTNTLPDGYEDFEIVISKDGEVSAELTAETEWECGESGEYTVWLYAKRNSELIPCAKYNFFVYPKLTADDTFLFVAEKPYYVHNGQRHYYTDDGFVPLMANENIYLDKELIKNISGIELSDTSALYKGEIIVSELSTVSEINGTYSFNQIAAALGYSFETQEDVLCVSKVSGVKASDCDAAFDYVLNHSLDGSTVAWNGMEYPDGWGFYDWSSSSQGFGFGGCTEDKTHGSNSVYINAVEKKNTAYAAYTYRLTNCDLKGYLYAVSFDVKYSDDLAGNIPFAALGFDSDSGFLGHLQGTAVEGKKGEWTRVTSYFTREALDKYSGFTKVSLMVGAKAVDAAVSGKIYFDNVSMREMSIIGEAAEAEIVCSAFGAWHKLGENVKYLPQNEDKLYGFDKICGVVYDMDGEKVYENTVSLRSFCNSGWEYTPEKPGYYEAEFYGIRSDGTRSLTVNCYTSVSDVSYTAYNLARHSFAVVEGEARPMNERPDFLLISDDATNTDELRLINMLGFSGIRIHGIPWGSTAGSKGFEPTKGNFDWTYADAQINNVKKAGFKNIIANVFATPTWAVNNDESGYNMVGWYYKNCFKADDNNDIANAYGAFTERYKDKITGIEVWNEPHYGRTAFWCDTPDNFAELAVTAYKAIKAKAPDMTVYSAGFNRAYVLFDKLMEDREFRENAFDAISFHGRYDEDIEYRQTLAKYGMDDIPLINSEGYYYAYYKKNTPKDHRHSNMQMYMCYLNHIKNNVDMAGIFEITDNNCDEKRVNGAGGHTMGLFRHYPYYEPTHGAVTAYNFINSLGSSMSFKGEYDFGSGRKAIAVENDGKSEIYIWNAEDKDFALPDELEACMTENSKIIDFEGNETDMKNLKKLRFYRITNLSPELTAALGTTEGAVFHSDYEAPYYTCRNSFGETIEEYTPQTGVFSEGSIFSKDNFSELDGAHYNNDGFVWNAADGTACGINARFAAAVGEDALELIIKVFGDDNASYADSAPNIVNADGVRIGIDCGGRLRADGRAEFFAGLVNNKPTLYKYIAADINEAVPENWNPAGTVLTSDYIDISAEGNETVYKICLPCGELYPYTYCSSNKKDLRISIAISDADNGVKHGDLCYGAGLTEENPRVWKYALLSEYALSKGADIYYSDGKIYINGTPKTGSKYVALVLTKEDGSIVNLDQINNAGESYSKQFLVTPGVKYTVTINDENRNSFTKTITAK